MAKRAKKTVKKETPAQRLSGIIKTCRKIMRKDKGLNGDADRLPMLTWLMFLKFMDDMEQEQETKALLNDKTYIPVIESPYRWRDWAKNDGWTGDDLLNFINNENTTLPDGKEGMGLLYYLRGLQSESGRSRKDVLATVFKGLNNRMINGYLLRDVINKIDGIHFTSNEEVNTLSLLYENLLKEMRDAAGDAGEFYTPRPVVKFMVEMVAPKLEETILDPAAGTGGFLVSAFEQMKKQAKSTEQWETLQKSTIQGGEAKPLPYLLCQMNLLLHGLEYPDIDPLNSLRFPLKDIGDSQRVDVILTNPPFGGEEERGILNNFPSDKQSSETSFLFIQLLMRKLKRPVPLKKGGRCALVVPKGTLYTEGVNARIMKQLIEEFNLHTIVRLPKGVFAPYTDISSNLLFFENSHEKTSDIWYYEIQPPEGRKNYTKTIPMRYEEFSDIKSWWKNRTENENSWIVNCKEVISETGNGGFVVNLDHKNPNKEYVKQFRDVRDILGLVKHSIDDISQRIISIETNIKNFLISDISFKVEDLSEVLTQYREIIYVEDLKEYRQLTISKHDGIKVRGIKQGINIGRKRQFVVNLDKYPNTIIYTRQTIQADEVIGLAPEEVNGCIVTENMPMFSVDNANPKYVNYFFKSEFFLSQLRETSAKGTSQQTIHEDKFLTYKIPLPELSVQDKIVNILEELNSLNDKLSNDSILFKNLFPSFLLKIMPTSKITGSQYFLNDVAKSIEI